ncbi:cupredoxin domain-containing protein [Halorarum salinum]|uniref:Blue (type 1) copper domain-containing protein n=1 Tax=Halorarum salinum TaxID=2743089 RepID=A0A7D5QBS1_9EURY|nr:plastocyanin/azurin family copper-binding protein [Halobaculum salinum]QLG63277.1 hypothetical protein HUG12_16680 [Halobaculum salinum]
MTRKQTDDDVTSSGGGFGAFRRRPVLLALGAGSSIGLASQYGRANVQEDGEGDGGGTDGDGATTGERCAPCLDRYSGYLRVAESEGDGGEPEDVAPVVTVEMRVDDADVVFRGRPEPDAGTEAPTAGTPSGTEVTTETGSPPPTGEADVGTPSDGTATVTPSMEGDEGVPDFYFDPVGISLQPGDTVEFVTVEDIHTVTAYHPRFFGFQRRVPEGVPGFSSPPVLEGDSWYYRFEEPGVYDMLCLPHDGLGMVVRAVVAGEGSEDPPEAYPERPPEESGVSPINQRVLNAPELDPGNVLAAGTVAWTDLTDVASGRRAATERRRGRGT